MTRAGTKHATAADLAAKHARHGTKVGHAVPLAAAKAALRVLYRGALPAAGQDRNGKLPNRTENSLVHRVLILFDVPESTCTEQVYA
jgi:hypothetical protein